MMSNFCWLIAPEQGGWPWSVVDIPTVTPLKKTDFPIPRSYQLQTASIKKNEYCWNYHSTRLQVILSS